MLDNNNLIQVFFYQFRISNHEVLVQCGRWQNIEEEKNRISCCYVKNVEFVINFIIWNNHVDQYK
jgi:hypothetical protein